MREKIYTIPVTDAFRVECECSLCFLEKKLEEEYIEYILGPSLMEPEGRIETNEKGFCKEHFEKLYNKQINRLGLGLILETHIDQQNSKIANLYGSKVEALKKDSQMSMMKNISSKVSPKRTDTEKLIDELVNALDGMENKCTVCSKLEYTMDRYIDVTLYLWFKESEFKEMFNNKKGFCLKHLKELLKGADKYLNPRDKAVFVNNLMDQQLNNLQRIKEEVSWFTKKFDYRNNDAPWGNSKDAVPRSIQKIVGFCGLNT